MGDFLDVDSSCDNRFKDKFNLVVSNPPYIDPAEEPHLDIQVTKFEPSVALFSGESGYFHTVEYMKKVRKILVPGGHFILELEPEKITNFEQRVQGMYDCGEFKFSSDWRVAEKKEDVFGLMRFLVLEKL